jgi:hypothetical protein
MMEKRGVKGVDPQLVGDISLSPFLPSYQRTFLLLFEAFRVATFHAGSHKCYTALQSDHAYT